jgi:hypothetical protein
MKPLKTIRSHASVENGHGIPAGFLTYMNEQSGPLGRLFVFGYSISGAHWVTAKVGGREQPVLFPVFERRVLTYTPGNPAPFQVEVGNVGRHYLLWRYAAPTVEVLPSRGPAGTTFTVRVSGLAPGEQARVVLSPSHAEAAQKLHQPSSAVGRSRLIFELPPKHLWEIGPCRLPGL